MAGYVACLQRFYSMVNILSTGHLLMDISTKSEDPDENAAFHKGVHCLLR